MDMLNVRGKIYHRAIDGLFYRDEIVNDITYSVPMYVNRLPYGWQVRFARKNERYFSKSFADSKTGLTSPAQQVGASLAEATDEIKRQFAEGAFNTRDECTKKLSRYLMLERNSAPDNIPGVNVHLVFPKPNDREKTPYIRIFCQLGIHRKKRQCGPSFSPSIFSISKSEFESHIRLVVLHRKYMEQQRLNDKVYAPAAVVHFSRDKENALLKDVDLSIYQLEDFVSDVEKKWADQQIEIDFPVEITEHNDAITVKRIPNSSRQHPQAKTFRISSYGARELTLRIARLYQQYLQSSSPIILPGAVSKSGPKPSSIRNKTPQARTGITGVTLWTRMSRPALYFVSVYWKDGDSEPTTNQFSVLKYGLYGAFLKARQKFNEQRNMDESETASQIGFQRILPKVLAQVTQEHIDHLGIAEELEGVVYSQAS